MVDVALQGNAIEAGEAVSRARALKRLRVGDLVFHALTRAAAIGVLLLLGGVIISLISGSLPALRRVTIRQGAKFMLIDADDERLFTTDSQRRRRPHLLRS